MNLTSLASSSVLSGAERLRLFQEQLTVQNELKQRLANLFRTPRQTSPDSGTQKSSSEAENQKQLADARRYNHLLKMIEALRPKPPTGKGGGRQSYTPPALETFLSREQYEAYKSLSSDPRTVALAAQLRADRQAIAPGSLIPLYRKADGKFWHNPLILNKNEKDRIVWKPTGFKSGGKEAGRLAYWPEALKQELDSKRITQQEHDELQIKLRMRDPEFLGNKQKEIFNKLQEFEDLADRYSGIHPDTKMSPYLKADLEKAFPCGIDLGDPKQRAFVMEWVAKDPSWAQYWFNLSATVEGRPAETVLDIFEGAGNYSAIWYVYCFEGAAAADQYTVKPGSSHQVFQYFIEELRPSNGTWLPTDGRQANYLTTQGATLATDIVIDIVTARAAASMSTRLATYLGRAESALKWEREVAIFVPAMIHTLKAPAEGAREARARGLSEADAQMWAAYSLLRALTTEVISARVGGALDRVFERFATNAVRSVGVIAAKRVIEEPVDNLLDAVLGNGFTKWTSDNNQSLFKGFLDNAGTSTLFGLATALIFKGASSHRLKAGIQHTGEHVHQLLAQQKTKPKKAASSKSAQPIPVEAGAHNSHKVIEANAQFEKDGKKVEVQFDKVGEHIDSSVKDAKAVVEDQKAAASAKTSEKKPETEPYSERNPVMPIAGADDPTDSTASKDDAGMAGKGGSDETTTPGGTTPPIPPTPQYTATFPDGPEWKRAVIALSTQPDGGIKPNTHSYQLTSRDFHIFVYERADGKGYTFHAVSRNSFKADHNIENFKTLKEAQEKAEIRIDKLQRSFDQDHPRTPEELRKRVADSSRELRKNEVQDNLDEQNSLPEDKRDPNPPKTIEQADKRIEDNLKRIAEESTLAMRVESKALDAILSDGRIKSLHETNTSGGLAQPRLRGWFEGLFNHFKYYGDEKPIYGYLASDPIGHGSDSKGPVALDQYGEVIIVLKDELKARSTMVVGDSLDMGLENKAVPSAMASPEAHSGYGIFFKKLLAPHIKANDLVKPEYGTYTPYIEAQTYGGVSVKDIRHLVFPKDKPPSAELRQRLDKNKIQYTIDNKWHYANPIPLHPNP